MRRPFLIFFVLIALYFWLKDLTALFFYLIGSDSSNLKVYSTVISILLFGGILYLLKISIFKKIPLPTIKEVFQPERKKEWLLLLLVSLPLLALGLIRCIYPDHTWDTYHYELYLQEFNFNESKTNFTAGGKGTYLFPLSERIIGLFRYILGYRLGSIFNVLLLITILISCYDFTKKFISVYGPTFKYAVIIPALFALYIVLADNTLFNIGSYKTDLQGIPFLLELVHIIYFGTRYSKKVTYLLFFLLVSFIITFKITFLPFAGIFSIIFLFKNYKNFHPAFLLSIPVITLLFPSIYMLYSGIETGNPVYPLFNKYFKAPSFYPENFKDGRWGPTTITETLYFHIITFFDRTRVSEWRLFSYRYLLGYLTCVGVITFYLLRFKRNKNNLFYKQLVLLSMIALLIDFSWAITTGYARYGIILEVLYGLIITLLLISIKEKISSVLLIFAILFQFATTFQNMFVKQINLSWHEYKDLFYNKELFKENAGLILHDYGQITDNSNILPSIDAMVTVDPCVYDGLAKMLNKKAAIYQLSGNRLPEFINKVEKDIIRPLSLQKNVFVVGEVTCFDNEWVGNLNKKGFMATDMYEVYPDFMKYNEPAFLFKIKYFDTSRYTIKSTTKIVTVGGPAPNDSLFTYKANQKAKVFIREAPYTFGWPLNSYELYINDKTYKFNSKPPGSKIITLDTDSVSIRADQSKPCLVIIQEVEEKKQ